jgi:GAF domain-containing protein
MSSEPTLPFSALSALAGHLIDGGTLDDVLRHVSDVAVDVLPGADEASLTLLTDGVAKTYGATSELPLAADEKQYEAGSGPCVDAARGNRSVLVPDLARDRRWSAAPRMAEVGARSSLSLPLPVQGEAIGALNIYARRTDAFDEAAVHLGEAFAGFAAVAVANAVSFSTAADAARRLQAAMESRAVIEQAKGILMGSTGCDADGAFRLLVQQSQHQNRKLREIAAELVAGSTRTRGDGQT